MDLRKLAWKRNSIVGRMSLIHSHINSLKESIDVLTEDEIIELQSIQSSLRLLMRNSRREWEKIKNKQNENINSRRS